MQHEELRQSGFNQSPKQTRCRDVILKIAKVFYFMHLLIALVASIALLILQPELRQRMSQTLILIIIYGFIVVWLSIINIFFVIISKQKCAVWCNRVIVKFIIMLFPVMYVLCKFKENFLNLTSVRIFMVYYLVVSILLIIFQVYSCTYGHHNFPNYVTKDIQLHNQENQVHGIRKLFYQLRNKTFGPQTNNTNQAS